MLIRMFCLRMVARMGGSTHDAVRRARELEAYVRGERGDGGTVFAR